MLCFVFVKHNLIITLIKFFMFMGKKRKSLRYCRNYLRLHFIIIIKTLYYHHSTINYYYYNYNKNNFYNSTFSSNFKNNNNNNFNLIVLNNLSYFCCKIINLLLKIYRIFYIICFKNYKKILKPYVLLNNKQIWNIKSICVYKNKRPLKKSFIPKTKSVNNFYLKEKFKK